MGMSNPAYNEGQKDCRCETDPQSVFEMGLEVNLEQVTDDVEDAKKAFDAACDFDDIDVDNLHKEWAWKLRVWDALRTAHAWANGNKVPPLPTHAQRAREFARIINK